MTPASNQTCIRDVKLYRPMTPVAGLVRPRDVSVPGRALLLKTLHECDIDHKYMIYDEVAYNIGYYLY